MLSIATDLLSARVTVSLWLESERRMSRLLTGRVRAVGCYADGFGIIVETEVSHRVGVDRPRGALSAFTLSNRGGIEILPVPESAAYKSYVACKAVLQTTTDPSSRAALLSKMEGMWHDLTNLERDIVDAGSDGKSR